MSCTINLCTIDKWCRSTGRSIVMLLTVFTASFPISGLSDDIPSGDPVMMSIYVDNDLFTGTSKDEDYTGGFAFTYSGSSAAKHPFSIDKPLGKINQLTGVHELMGIAYDDGNNSLHSCEAGLAVFTPTEILNKKPILNDRPYSSLIYISNTQQTLSQDKQSSLITSLSLGVLGLSVAGEIQNGIHTIIGSDEAEGWDNQISNGGELTFKYSATLQQYIDTGNENYQVTTSLGMSLGYITEAAAGINLRAGIVRTPRWSFNVNNSNYGEKTNVTTPATRHLDEFYFIAGANLKARAYNALLQGQFRNSKVEYSSDEIENLIYEGWVGLGCEFSSGLRLSYLFRHQSSELKTGLADRSFSYAELVASYKF